MKLLIIVLLDGRDLLPNVPQLPDLVFHLVLKEADLVFEILYTQLVKHHYIVVAMLTQKTLEADRAEAVLAEGFDLFCRVDLASTLLELTDLIVTHCLLPSLFSNFNSNYYNN